MASIADLAELVLGGANLAAARDELVAIADPAAGSSAVRRIPGEAWERVIAVRYTFAASAVVKSRYIHAQLLDENSNLIAGSLGTGGIAASAAVNGSMVRGLHGPTPGTSGYVDGSLFDLIGRSGWYFRLYVENMDAGDALSGVQLFMTRYPTDAVKVII